MTNDMTPLHAALERLKANVGYETPWFETDEVLREEWERNQSRDKRARQKMADNLTQRYGGVHFRNMGDEPPSAGMLGMPMLPEVQSPTPPAMPTRRSTEIEPGRRVNPAWSPSVLWDLPSDSIDTRAQHVAPPIPTPEMAGALSPARMPTRQAVGNAMPPMTALHPFTGEMRPVDMPTGQIVGNVSGSPQAVSQGVPQPTPARNLDEITKALMESRKRDVRAEHAAIRENALKNGFSQSVEDAAREAIRKGRMDHYAGLEPMGPKDRTFWYSGPTGNELNTPAAGVSGGGDIEANRPSALTGNFLAMADQGRLFGGAGLGTDVKGRPVFVEREKERTGPSDEKYKESLAKNGFIEQYDEVGNVIGYSIPGRRYTRTQEETDALRNRRQARRETLASRRQAMDERRMGLQGMDMPVSQYEQLIAMQNPEYAAQMAAIASQERQAMNEAGLRREGYDNALDIAKVQAGGTDWNGLAALTIALNQASQGSANPASYTDILNAVASLTGQGGDQPAIFRQPSTILGSIGISPQNESVINQMVASGVDAAAVADKLREFGASTNQDVDLAMQHLYKSPYVTGSRPYGWWSWMYPSQRKTAPPANQYQPDFYPMGG